MAEWLRRLALKLLVPPLGFGFESHESQLSVENGGCWFSVRNNVFLKVRKLPALYNEIRWENGVNTNSPLSLTHTHTHIYRHTHTHTHTHTHKTRYVVMSSTYPTLHVLTLFIKYPPYLHYVYRQD